MGWFRLAEPTYDGDQIEMIDSAAALRRRGSVTLVVARHPVVEAALVEYAAYRVVSEIEFHSAPDGPDTMWAPTMSVYDFDEVAVKWLSHASARTGPSE